MAPSPDGHAGQTPSGDGPPASAASGESSPPTPVAGGGLSPSPDPDMTPYEPAPASADPNETRVPLRRPSPGLPPSGRARIPSGEWEGTFRFGDYELLNVIGRGGMGVVYKARQIKAGGRLVALKMIAAHLAGPDALERFRREAQAAAALNHPSIVPVYEVGEVYGDPYYTMALVDGGNLHQEIKDNGPLPCEAASLVLWQLAKAVQCAHDNPMEIIHRDIKPQNILLQRPATTGGEGDEGIQGRSESCPMNWKAVTPMLTDFGLARAKGVTVLTITNETMGTFGYMPPEQARGDRAAIGRHSDVYSLGAVLYCALTGRPPFQADSVERAVRLACDEEPEPPHCLRPEVDRDLEAICLKCLAKEPGQRYKSASALAEDLRRVLDDLPLKYARRSGPWARAVGRLARSMCRRPLRTAYMALSLAAFVVLGTLWFSRLLERWGAFDRDLGAAREVVDRAKEARDNGNRTDARKCYDDASRLFAKLKAEHGDRSDAWPHWAELHTNRAINLVDLKEYQEAEEDFAKAREYLISLVERNPERDDYQRKLSEVYHNLGILCDAQSTNDAQRKALSHYHDALKIRRALCERDSQNRKYLRDLARSYGYRGDTQLALGLEQEAGHSYALAEKHRQKLVDDDANDPEAKYQLARSLQNTGAHHEWCGRLEEAIKAHRERLAFFMRHGMDKHEPPADFRTDLAGCKLDIARLELDRPAPPGEEPRRLLEEALQVYEPLVRGTSDKGRLLSLIQGRVYLGKYHFRAGDPDEARHHLEGALKVIEQLGSTDNRSQGDLYHEALARALETQIEKTGVRDRAGREVLRYLDLAFKAGFRNVRRLQADSGFEPFRKLPEFDSIILRIEEQRHGNARDPLLQAEPERP